MTQDELWEGFFAEHYRRRRAGAGQADLRQLRRGHPARRGEPDARGPVRAGRPASGWSATWSRPCRWARTRSRPRSARPGVAGSEVGMLVVCSCTGYVTPGLDILLARDLGLPADARRVFVGHMGCYAALPGLGVAADYVALERAPGRAALRRADQPARPTAHCGPSAGGGPRAVLRRGGGGGAGPGRGRARAWPRSPR